MPSEAGGSAMAHLCTELLLEAALPVIAPGPHIGHVVFRVPEAYLSVCDTGEHQPRLVPLPMAGLGSSFIQPPPLTAAPWPPAPP